MIKAILFDRDGVILDSEVTHITAVVGAFRELGIKLTKSDEKLIIGMHPDNYIPELEKKYDFSREDFFKISTKLYYKHFGKAKIFREAVNLMGKLKRAGYKIGLTTSSGKKSTDLLLQRVKRLNNYLDVIVTREDYKNSKPDPEPYLTTAKKLKVAPKNCLVIEDSLAGLTSAKRAGMKCIVIPTRLTKKYDFKDADLIVKSAKDINIEEMNNI